MSKIVVVGDLHIGVRDGNEAFFDFQMTWISKMLDWCVNNNVTQIIQLGDMFDVRRSTNNQILWGVGEVLGPMIERAGIDWNVLIGNHDTYYKTTSRVNTPRICQRIMNIDQFTVIDVPVERDGILYIPWINDDNIEEVHKSITNSKCKVVVGHFEFVGFPVYNGIDAQHGINSDVFSKFDLVLSGHYHTVSRKRNIQYCGAPYHLTWSDEIDGTNRGFWVLDGDNLSMVPNEEHETLFMYHEYDETHNYDDAKSLFGGRVVKVIVNTKTNKKAYEQFVKILNGSGAISSRIIDNTLIDVTHQSTTVSIDDIKQDNIVEIMSRYCDASDVVSEGVKNELLDVYSRVSK